MKKILVLLLGLVILTSCGKNKQITFGGVYLLDSAFIYTENLDTYELTKYSHFGEGKTVSCLSGYEEPSFPIEVIEQGVTTWEFDNDVFILNGDYGRPMGITYFGDYFTIIEHPTSGISMLGGSSRPFQISVYDYKKKIVRIMIQEQYMSHNSENLKIINELYFTKISVNH